jgi:integrase
MQVPKLINKADFALLLEHLTTERDVLLVKMLFGTGCRIGELVGSRVGDLDLDEGLLHLDATRTKTKEYREVLIPGNLLPEIRSWISGKSPGEWLFPGQKEDSHITPRRVQQIVSKAADAAGIQRVYGLSKDGRRLNITSPHVLRHLHAVEALAGGVPLNALQDQLGHSALQTTAIYLKAGIDHRRRSYEGFGADIPIGDTGAVTEEVRSEHREEN